MGYLHTVLFVCDSSTVLCMDCVLWTQSFLFILFLCGFLFGYSPFDFWQLVKFFVWLVLFACSSSGFDSYSSSLDVLVVIWSVARYVSRVLIHVAIHTFIYAHNNNVTLLSFRYEFKVEQTRVLRAKISTRLGKFQLWKQNRCRPGDMHTIF